MAAISRAVSFILNNLEEEIGIDKLLKVTNMSKPTFSRHEFILKASPTPLISVEEFKAHSNQEDSVSLLDILAKPGEKDPFVLLSMQQMKNKLADAVAELEEREQLVLSLYYQEEMNLKEIGEILGVIESRVSQIRTKTILKLRAKLRLMTRDGMED
jgi:RNA polymerase sigma factor for flagellar operon FliA